jgi:hypothetical protein
VQGWVGVQPIVANHQHQEQQQHLANSTAHHHHHNMLWQYNKLQPFAALQSQLRLRLGLPRCLQLPADRFYAITYILPTTSAAAAAATTPKTLTIYARIHSYTENSNKAAAEPTCTSRVHTNTALRTHWQWQNQSSHCCTARTFAPREQDPTCTLDEEEPEADECL